MTELLINNLNKIENHMINIQKDVNHREAKSIGMDNDSAFNKIFNKKVDKIGSSSTESVNIDNNSEMIGVKSDINELNSNETISFKNIDMLKTDDISKNDIFEKIAEIREFIQNVTEEANVENSLDLTLTKNIEDLIEQLKDYCKFDTKSSVSTDIWGLDVEQIQEEDCDTLNNILKNITSLLELESKDDIKNEIAVNFEQLLSYFNQVSLKTEDELKVPVQEVLEPELELSDSNFDSYLSQNELIDISAEIDSLEVCDLKNKSSEQEFIMEEDMLKELNIESIRAELDSSSNDQQSLLQNQTPQEQGIKAMIGNDVEVFDIKLGKTMNSEPTLQTEQLKQAEIHPSRILDQITRQINNLQNGSKINMVLNPESLGKVNIQLLSTKEGLSAQFTVTTQEAKDLLLKGLDDLKDTLKSCGVATDNILVKLTDSQKSEYEQDWTEQEGSNGGNKEQKRQHKEKELQSFEKLIAQAAEEENGNV